MNRFQIRILLSAVSAPSRPRWRPTRRCRWQGRQWWWRKPRLHLQRRAAQGRQTPVPRTRHAAGPVAARHHSGRWVGGQGWGCCWQWAGWDPGPWDWPRLWPSAGWGAVAPDVDCVGGCRECGSLAWPGGGGQSCEDHTLRTAAELQTG